MRTPARSTRRTVAQPSSVGNENRSPTQQESVPSPSPKKARHRLSAAELARLEDVFKQDTHPSRQQKKDLAAELGMDYKTVMIWFQNKRQTSKRGQPPPVERPDQNTGRAKVDSCLRAVSSPSLNATLGDASGSDQDHLAADGAESKGAGGGPNTITAKAISKIKPLLDSLNALTPRPRGHAESTGSEANFKDIDSHSPETSSESPIASTESNRHDHLAEGEQTKGKPLRWKRVRTLEWACERQTKRRKLSRETYARLESEEAEDPNDMHVESALSLLSLSSSTHAGPPKDVIRGASLLLSFKHSWRRK